MDEFLLIEAAKGGDGKSEAKVVGLAYGGGKMTLVGWPVPVVVDLAGLRFASRVPVLTNHENKTSARVGFAASPRGGGRATRGSYSSSSPSIDFST